MVCNLLINGVCWGYNPLILTFDPNFLGHPSSLTHPVELKPNYQYGKHEAIGYLAIF